MSNRLHLKVWIFKLCLCVFLDLLQDPGHALWHFDWESSHKRRAASGIKLKDKIKSQVHGDVSKTFNLLSFVAGSLNKQLNSSNSSYQAFLVWWCHLFPTKAFNLPSGKEIQSNYSSVKIFTKSNLWQFPFKVRSFFTRQHRRLGQNSSWTIFLTARRNGLAG